MINKIRLLINKKGFKFFLPLCYVLALIFSLILFLLIYIFPGLTIETGGWMTFSFPIGAILAILISFPGFIISGWLKGIFSYSEWFSFSNQIEVYITFFSWFILSFLFYSIIGLMIDKLKKHFR